MSHQYQIETRIPYVLIGSDFSQQEPKMAAYLSKDTGLMKAAQEAQYVKLVLAGEPLTKKEQRTLEQKSDEQSLRNENTVNASKPVNTKDYNWDE